MNLLTIIAKKKRQRSTTPVEAVTLIYSGIDEDDSESGFLHQARAYGSSDPWFTYGTSSPLGGIGSTFSVQVPGHPFNTDLECRTIAVNSNPTVNAYPPIRVKTTPQFGPTSLIVSNITSNGATVTFTPPPTIPLTGYRLYVREVNGDWILADTITNNENEFIITGLPSTITSYEIAATAYNDNDESIGDAETLKSDIVSFETSAFIGWYSPVDVDTIGDVIVSTEGALVSAYNIGENTSRTVNTVQFQGLQTIGGLNNSAVLASLYTGNGVGTGFAGIMRSLAYGTPPFSPVSIQLEGLITGHTYLLQVFMSDNRTDNNYNLRTQKYIINGLESEAPIFDMSYSMICRFLATNTSHELTIQPIGTVAHLAAYQVRKLS